MPPDLTPAAGSMTEVAPDRNAATLAILTEIETERRRTYSPDRKRHNAGHLDRIQQGKPQPEAGQTPSGKPCRKHQPVRDRPRQQAGTSKSRIDQTPTGHQDTNRAGTPTRCRTSSRAETIHHQERKQTTPDTLPEDLTAGHNTPDKIETDARPDTLTESEAERKAGSLDRLQPRTATLFYHIPFSDRQNAPRTRRQSTDLYYNRK